MAEGNNFRYCPHCGKSLTVNDTLRNKKPVSKDIRLIILRCLNHIDCNAGRSLLSSVLMGYKTKAIQQTNQNENPYYGFLRNIGHQETVDGIDELVADGHLAIDTTLSRYNHPILKLTGLAQEEISKSEKTEQTPPKRETHLHRIQELHPNAYTPWDDELENRLKELFLENKPIKEIAQVMGRQPSAIRARLLKMGLVK